MALFVSEEKAPGPVFCRSRLIFAGKPPSVSFYLQRDDRGGRKSSEFVHTPVIETGYTIGKRSVFRSRRQKGSEHKMQNTWTLWVRQLGTLEFWQTLFDSFGDLGPLAPVGLAMVESFFPPLPLVAIVALNVAAHGGLLGFLYSWLGVVLGAGIMFLFWRRVVKRHFWKLAHRFPRLEKAQQWVNRFDTSSLFMLTLLPFTPSSFMHLAFGISDFDEKRYLVTVVLAKGVMVAMMALFGQSLVSSLRDPTYLILAVALWAGMYWASKKFCKRHHLD